jgi:hypothetical protein
MVITLAAVEAVLTEFIVVQHQEQADLVEVELALQVALEQMV